jgi:hypothetical protein
MSTVPPPLPPDSQSTQKEGRERVADIRLYLLVQSGRLGRRLRVRLSNRRRAKHGLAQGELIVAFTNEEDARSRALAAVNIAVERTKGLGKVEFIPVRRIGGEVSRQKRERWRWTERTPPEDEWNVRRGLTRSYVGVATDPGLESVVHRAIRIAAWRFRLPKSRRGLVVMYSPAVVPAQPFVPRGPIEFSADYQSAKKLVGADRVDARGVTIMVIDPDLPDLDEIEPLFPDIRERVRIPGGGEIRSGHGTLMTAIVADIARNADIVAVAMREPGVEAFGVFSLIGLLNQNFEDVDLIMASVTFGEAKDTWAEKGKHQSLVDAFTGRRYQAQRPPALFPTGNLDEGVDVKVIGVPARLAATLGIGCAVATKEGVLMCRSDGSCHGKKDDDPPLHWWLAPGGGFRRVGDVDPFVKVNGEPQAGTSIANAFAAGMLAGVVRRLRKQSATRTPELAANVRYVNEKLAATPDSEQSREILDHLGEEFSGSVSFDRLARECETLANPKLVDPYDAFEHGGGVLTLSVDRGNAPNVP